MQFLPLLGKYTKRLMPKVGPDPLLNTVPSVTCGCLQWASNLRNSDPGQGGPGKLSGLQRVLSWVCIVFESGQLCSFCWPVPACMRTLAPRFFWRSHTVMTERSLGQDTSRCIWTGSVLTRLWLYGAVGQAKRGLFSAATRELPDTTGMQSR